MANKITTVIDFVTTGAQRSVKTFRQSISEAEGGLNKFKAGASSAMQTVQANAGNLALAGGAALAAFGAKSIAAFQETAIAAGKFSDATGLAVEDASRLREVAGDVGIGVDSISGAITRLNKAAASGDLQKFGIELQRTADGTVDVNETFLETIDVLGQIQDPTERALAAQKIFGKGYREVAELIFDSAENVRAKLDEVSEAKVIDEDELRKARDFRESMDNLHDALEDIQLAAGEALVPLVSDLADVIVKAKEGKDALEDMTGVDIVRGATNLAAPFAPFKKAIDDIRASIKGTFTPFPEQADRFSDSILRVGASAEDAAEDAKDLAEAAQETEDRIAEMGDKAANSGPKIGDMAGALDEARDHLAELNEQARDNAMDTLAAAIKGVGDALDESFGDLEDDLGSLDLLDDIKDQFDAIAEAQDKATDDKGVRDLNREIRRLQGQLLDYLRTVDDIPPDKVTEIIAQIRTGDIETLKQTLDDLTKDRFINIGIIGATNPGFTSSNFDFNPAAGTITPTFQGVQSAIPPSNVTIIYPVGTTPTTQFINGQIDTQRNGTRNPNLQ